MTFKLRQRITTVGLSLIVACAATVVPAQATAIDDSRLTHADTSTVELTSEQETLLAPLGYNTVTGLFEYDAADAIAAGADPAQARQLEKDFTGLTARQVSEFNQAIGFDAGQAATPQQPGQVAPQVLPALIPVLAALGKGAASAIAGAVTTWGVVEACKQLNGQYGVFDSFCGANGWV